MLSSTILIKYFLLGLITSLMVTSVLSRSVKRQTHEADAEALENETEQSLIRDKRQLGLGGLGGFGAGGLGGFGAAGLMGGGLIGGGGGILDLLLLSQLFGGNGGNGGHHHGHGK